MTEIPPDGNTPEPQKPKSKRDLKKEQAQSLTYTRRRRVELISLTERFPTEEERRAYIALVESWYQTTQSIIRLNYTFDEFHSSQFCDLANRVSPLEKRVGESPVLFTPEIQESLKKIREKFFELGTEDIAKSGLDYLKQNPEEIRKGLGTLLALIRNPESQEFLIELMRTPEAKEIGYTLQKSATRKFWQVFWSKPAIYISTIATALVLVGGLGLSAYNFFKKYESSTEQVAKDITALRQADKGFVTKTSWSEKQKKLDEAGAKQEKERKEREEKVDKRIGDLEEDTKTKLENIGTKYDGLNTRLNDAETALKSRPDLNTMTLANNSIREDLTAEIARLRKEYAASSTQDKQARANYEAKLTSLTQKLTYLEKLFQQEQDAKMSAELQEFLDGLRQPFKLELYPTSQSPQTSQPSSRPAPELKPEYQQAE